MKTRVDKYTEEEMNLPPRRVSKNTNLYEEIKNSELENFTIGSNAKVIADNDSQIDIDKLKDILEKNYQELPKKRAMKFEMEEEEEKEEEKEPTKEYDINAILEQAREEKEEDYQKDRLKKIRDTQFDILKNLELEAKNKEANEVKSKEELLELINTINLNEIQSKNGKKLKEEVESLDPLEILTELKGDDNTIVSGAKDFTEELEKFEVDSQELTMPTKKETSEEINDAMEETLDESFYTTNTSFNPKDFADVDDEDEKSHIILKILIFLVFVAIVVGIVLFLNDFLNLGWF